MKAKRVYMGKTQDHHLSDVCNVNDEKNCLIQILSDFLNERKSNPPNDKEWPELSVLAEAQQVGGIVYFQCGKNMPDDIRKRYEKQYFASVYNYANRRADLDQLDMQLRQTDIPYFIVKGIAVSQYYPVPELRTMGDTDIVVHEDDRARVREIMLNLGFEEESISKNEWHFRHHIFSYEVHDHLLYDEGVNDKRYRNFFNKCWDYVTNDQLNPNFHLLFLLIHLRKHLMGIGVGFRQFLDIAAMIKNEKHIDWEWIREKLSGEDLQLMDFASTCFSLIHRWFGISVPFEKKIDEAFYREATGTVLAGGIFGFEKVKNFSNSTVNDIREKPVNRFIICVNGIREIFPSAKKLALNPRYLYLDGRPYLLPAAYVHRLTYGLLHFSEKKYILKGYFPSESNVRRRKKYLNHWGL